MASDDETPRENISISSEVLPLFAMCSFSSSIPARRGLMCPLGVGCVPCRTRAFGSPLAFDLRELRPCQLMGKTPREGSRGAVGYFRPGACPWPPEPRCSTGYECLTLLLSRLGWVLCRGVEGFVPRAAVAVIFASMSLGPKADGIAILDIHKGH